MVQLLRHTGPFAAIRQRRARQRHAGFVETMFRSLIESMPDALVIVDQRGRIVLVNRRTEALFGYRRQELLGQALECLLPERFHQPHRDHWERYLCNRSTSPIGSGLELYGQRKDGHEFPVDISLSSLHTPGDPYIISSIRDITEQRRLKQSACSYEALLQLVFDQQPGGVYLVQGPRARLILMNRAAASLWGASWLPGQAMEDFLAAHQIRVLDCEGKELIGDELATLRAFHTGQPVHQYQEVIHRQLDGTELPVLFNAVVLPSTYFESLDFAEPGQHGVLVVMQDISSLKAAEHLKDDFIGLAAHELRNPLAALKGLADTLVVQARYGRGTPLTEWQQEVVTEIILATDRLVALTESLLDVSRVQSGCLVLSIELRDLIALARKVIQRFQGTTTRHTICLHTDLPSLPIPMDALRIDQVLSNLLHNAVKYSPDGGVIEVVIQARQGMALVQVRDDGIGIPLDQQPHLFQRFSRAENARKMIGSGLGLYLCRELIERHGGVIWVQSVEGEGSIFSFNLPLISCPT